VPARSSKNCGDKWHVTGGEKMQWLARCAGPFTFHLSLQLDLLIGSGDGRSKQ